MTETGPMPGDLGRRVAHRREELGLSRQEVARRADMDPGYLEYLEERAANPRPGALLRLADALGTSPEALLGGTVERPPGGSGRALKPELEHLDPEECLRLIAPGGVGRVAFDALNGPTILPVNYRLHEGAVVFRTRYGGLLDEELHSGIKGAEITVAFEVDRLDEAMHAGWSVLIQGPAHLAEREELADLESAHVEPWPGGDRGLYIRVSPTHITGRRIHPA
ncbi:helix-turn-helix domain-containing protein [Bailinhaonella thermotolerans]|uniref:Helix-turn-helix domain-containing protein n=1 Tax=Bailinhaonella thermotolerans TaxID=1070861 RepID=A0A3A4AS58_9ACTN|nr:pyridoxamine 5'-phosphate oxidase family protein [Bailinhaonella thermotolerans]RJL32718.1 helix-turn-helix domain-containing protein [Bailinhaonella thermotolerans]